ncbi:putative immunoglobulin-like domain containing protein [Namao virus]|nr:putative immunoglobulin-like domain containing protein [Namao virus]
MLVFVIFLSFCWTICNGQSEEKVAVVNVTVGGNITLNCTYPADKVTIEFVRWDVNGTVFYFRKVNVSIFTIDKRYIVNITKNYTSLLINNIKALDIGVYSCHIRVTKLTPCLKDFYNSVLVAIPGTFSYYDFLLFAQEHQQWEWLVICGVILVVFGIFMCICRQQINIYSYLRKLKSTSGQNNGNIENSRL